MTLLIDSREKKRNGEDSNYFLDKMNSLGVHCEIRALPVGDFVWALKATPKERVCKGGREDGKVRDRYQEFKDGIKAEKQAKKVNKKTGGQTSHPGGESPSILLPMVIIERKSLRDLQASLSDGRYLGQAIRLLQTPFQKVLYLVEGEIQRNDKGSKWMQGAMQELRVLFKFSILKSKSIGFTANVLYNVHREVCQQLVDMLGLGEEEKDSGKKGPRDSFNLDSPRESPIIEESTTTGIKRKSDNPYGDSQKALQFTKRMQKFKWILLNDFMKYYKKQDMATVTSSFGNLLRNFRGFGKEGVEKVRNQFKTFYNFYYFMNGACNCSNTMPQQDENENSNTSKYSDLSEIAKNASISCSEECSKSKITDIKVFLLNLNKNQRSELIRNFVVCPLRRMELDF